MRIDRRFLFSRLFRMTSRVFLLIPILAIVFPFPNQIKNQTSARSANLQSQQVQTATPAATSVSNEKAASLLQRMTPEERVGQLFLVTFQGPTALPDSDIYELITDYYLGGVILTRQNDNFTDGEQTAANAAALTRQLQTARSEASRQSRTNPETNEDFIPAYIPLLIGIAQEGDGYPYDQILDGLTPLPNQMAIGATWSADLSRQAGTVLGQELSALGINLLLGPSLDVLETPHTDVSKDLGTRTFGGDPYWVGKLGQAYIEGVHQGSSNQIAVIAKYFPGHGGSDRLPEEEVATVRKSLDQLLSFELTPFIEVTGNAATPDATADGLLTAHIRYQGFQGNIRATTRPVSFDPQALQLLISLAPFSAWRENGGVMVSDNLGSRAVRGFYDLTSQTFDLPRRVALNAFLAGNDLLYIDDFSSGELDSITSAKRTLEFFAQKYREDPAFAQRVDESVLRILTLKYRLYDNFFIDEVMAAPELPEEIGVSEDVSFNIARQSATLLSPSQADLEEAIPDPPNQNDRLVFLTDTRTAQQCSQCPPQPLIGERALEQAVLRLYGPQAGGQVTPANLVSFTLADLQTMLDSGRGTTSLEISLKRANWIIFSMLDASERYPSYQTLRRFLTERPDLFQNKRLIVFAFNAPYFLDATDISKLTAYFGLYSKIPQAVDTAAYLLFKELQALGSPPVSVNGISYDLSTALFPDPEQIIPLVWELQQSATQETPTPPADGALPILRIGDVIQLTAGVVLDANGHPVPDGTPVEFLFSQTNDSNPSRQVATTDEGQARVTYTVTNSGSLQIQAVSEPASSEILQLEVPSITEGTASPTPNPPTATPSPTPTMTPTVVIATPTPPSPQDQVQFSDWIMAMLVTAASAWIAYRLFSTSGQAVWGLRAALMILIGGLFSYLYLILELPGSDLLLSDSFARGILIGTLIGAVAGLIVTVTWRAVINQRQ
jgi:beta-N-acetylhexosaminidase